VHFQLPVSEGLEALLQDASAQLAAASDQPRDEAEWLLSELLGVARAGLRTATALDDEQKTRFAIWVNRRAAGEPFAYVTGTQPFRRLSVGVTSDVLIPRADTEHLVAWALQVLTLKVAPARVLDVCTGSGCVALALADEASQHHIFGSDCSAAALAVAQANALRLKLPVQFLHADALSLPADTSRFQLITANPPYIAEHDPHLPALHHEPALALVSGADGLTLLRRLIEQAPAALEDQGWLLLEHGYDQGERVRALLAARGFSQVETRRDYGGNERVTGGCWVASHG